MLLANCEVWDSKVQQWFSEQCERNERLQDKLDESRRQAWKLGNEVESLKLENRHLREKLLEIEAEQARLDAINDEVHAAWVARREQELIDIWGEAPF